MAVTRACDYCGEPYTAQRSDSKFCADKCRSAHRQGKTPTPAEPTLGEQASVGLMASTLAELVTAGRENTALGQAALLLAYRLERSQLDTGSSIATMVKQHGATLAEAVRGAGRTVDPVDELRNRRDAKRAG